MKKSISVILALALVITSLSSLAVLRSDALTPEGLPESENDLKGTIVVDSLEDYKSNFSHVSGATYSPDTEMQSVAIGDLVTDGNNYWWRDNNYLVGLNTANQTGYLKNAEQYDKITMTTEFLTGANGMIGMVIRAGNNQVVVEDKMIGQTGSDPTVGYRPYAFGSGSAWYKIVCEIPVGTEAGQFEVTYANGSSEGFTTKLYKGNNQATAYESNTSSAEFAYPDAQKTWGIIRNYFGNNVHAVAYTTDTYEAGKESYNCYIWKVAKPLSSTGEILVEQYTNVIGGYKNMTWGGVTGTVSYTAQKTDGIWYITDVTYVIQDELVQFGAYAGAPGKNKLEWNSSTSPKITANSNGTHTVKFTGSLKITSETLNLRLPQLSTKCKTNDAFANLYFKNTTIEYEMAAENFLAAFETAYAEIGTNGVTVDTVDANNYSYVEAARAEYNKLTDFLKGYVESSKITLIEELEYAYNVGDSLSAWETAYGNLETALNGRDLTSMSLSDFEAIVSQITACRREYDAIDAGLKQYVVTAQVELLVAVETSYADLVANKENGTFFADFSNANGSNGALSTYFMNKKIGDDQYVIYGLANQNTEALWITGMVNNIDGTTYASATDVVKVEGGKAVYTLNRKGYNGNGHSAHVERSILQMVNNDYLPQDISKLSFTANLDNFETTGATYKEFVILYGKNANLSDYTAGDEELTDAPIFGTAVKISSDGTVTFGFAYYTHVASAYFENKVLNHIVTSYDMNSGSSQIANTAMTQPGDFLNNKISVAGDFNLEISFSKHTFTTDTTGIYNAMEVYVPTYTLVDCQGKKLTGTLTTYSGKLDDAPARKTHVKTFATEIYGLAIGSHLVSSTTPGTLELDDIYVQGEGAAAVTGATIKTADSFNEQDLRFFGSVSNNPYLEGKGYKAKGYGYILAVDETFAATGLSALELNSLTKEGDNWTGTVKGFDEANGNASFATVGYRELEAGTSLPADEFYINLGHSADALGGNAVGLRWRLRTFVRYENETSGDVKYVYSSNRAEGMMEGGEHVRSVYSVAKGVANAILLKEEAYTAFGTEGTSAQDYATAISYILAGTDGTNAVKSGTELSINGTNYKASEILLKFTSENAGLLED